MRNPIITLTTDFGLHDHYVGVMKGVILGIASTARIVDITHQIPAYSIPEAGFLLAQTYPYFPKRTVHVAVIDPGVGSARRAILVEAAGQYFIGPDNGLFSMIYSAEKHTVREITATRYFLSRVSNTFHGRDIFAPSAAHLASGIRPAAFGKRIEDFWKSSFATATRSGKRVWTGSIIRIDHFGNIVTTFKASEFPDLTLRAFEMQVGIQKVDRMTANYADAGTDGLFALVGSSGYFEVSANQKNAAKMLGVGVGAPVELTIL